jgi:hypothetical protein
MPGSSPRKAICRKQIRHSPNFRMKLRGRPQTVQRLCFCTGYFGVRFARSIMDFFAIR